MSMSLADECLKNKFAPRESKSRSRSRSRSRSYDKDKRSSSKRSRNSRSKSRSYRSRSSSRSYSKSRSRSRSRSYDRYHETDKDKKRRITNNTNSNDPNDLVSRIFIGNLPTDQLTRDDLEVIFKKYGDLRGVSIHKGFGFIQYNNEGDARAAVEGENGKYIKGIKIDVCIAIEGKKGFKKKPYRKEFDDAPRIVKMDNYNNSSKIPPLGFDPYAAYRGGNGNPMQNNPSHPLDCEIFFSSHKIRRYGESIVERLHTLGLRAVAKLLPEDMSPRLAVEGATRRGLLFCVTVNEENDIHRSLTLNICQDSPQEHRNMPLEAALCLISRTFDEHFRRIKEQTEGSKLSPTVGDFIPPNERTKYLLNLLADNRVLTIDEIDTVMNYLQERRSRLLNKNVGGIESNIGMQLNRQISSLFPSAMTSNMQHQPQMSLNSDVKIQNSIESLMSPSLLRNMPQTPYSYNNNSSMHY